MTTARKYRGTVGSVDRHEQLRVDAGVSFFVFNNRAWDEGELWEVYWEDGNYVEFTEDSKLFSESIAATIAGKATIVEGKT
jgi:hypothetical protein